MSFLKKLFAVGSTVAMLAGGFLPTAAQAAAHGAGSVVKKSDGAVGFIDSDNKLRWFTSGGAFETYGFLSWSQVVDANSDDLSLSQGSFIAPRDGSIFCATATKGTDVAGECALITGGMKAPFTSAAVFTGQGYSFARAKYGDSSFLSKTTNIDNAGAAHRQGTLVNIDGTVFLVGTSTLLGIPSVDVFNSWGYSFADTVTANAADRSMTRSGVMCSRVAGQLNPSFTAGSCSTGDVTTGDCNLSGGAGSIEDIRSISNLSNEDVGEGDSDVKVSGVEIDADSGSDLKLTAVKLELNQVDGTNTKFERYADNVTLWLGTTKLATVDAADFNRDNNFIKTISLSKCAEIPMDSTGKLYVAVSAVDNLDSNDVDGTWTMSIDSIRYVDAQGASTTEDGFDLPNDQDFNFTDFQSANDVKLKMTEGSDNPDAQTVEASDTAATNGVTLLKGTVKAEGSDIDVREITMSVDPNGNGTVPDIASEFHLMIDGDEVDSISATDCDDGTCTGTEDYTFDNVDTTINEGDTVDIEVTADINKIDGAFDEGDSLTATIDNGDTDAEDQNGDTVTDLTGSISGEAQTFMSTGISTSDFVSTASSTTDQNGDFTKQTYTISFSVTAFGDDYYIPKTTNCTDNSANTDGLVYSVEDSNGAAVDCTTTTGDIVTASSALSTTSGASTVGGYFKVAEGDTETFQFTVALSGATTPGFYHVQLDSVRYDTDQAGVPASQAFTPAQDYETADKQLD